MLQVYLALLHVCLINYLKHILENVKPAALYFCIQIM